MQIRSEDRSNRYGMNPYSVLFLGIPGTHPIQSRLEQSTVLSSRAVMVAPRPTTRWGNRMTFLMMAVPKLVAHRSQLLSLNDESE